MEALTDSQQAFYSRNFPACLNILEKACRGELDGNKREDARTAGMLALAKAARTYSPGKSRESTWVFKVVGQEVARALGKKRVDIDYGTPDVEEISDDGGILSVDLQVAIDSLGGDVSTVCRGLAAGKSVYEIGKELGVSGAAVNAIIAENRERIKEILS